MTRVVAWSISMIVAGGMLSTGVGMAAQERQRVPLTSGRAAVLRAFRTRGQAANRGLAALAGFRAWQARRVMLDAATSGRDVLRTFHARGGSQPRAFTEAASFRSWQTRQLLADSAATGPVILRALRSRGGTPHHGLEDLAGFRTWMEQR